MIKNFFKGLSAHIILILVCILSLLPFIWLLSTALKGAQENIFQYPPEFLPKFPTLDNFKEVLRLVPIVGYVVNSFIVAVFTVVLNLILSAMAAYPLARMEFAGKKIAFFAVLATIMVPFQAIMLPVYIITLKLNLVDSYGIIPGFIGMILPFAVNAFGIFLLRLVPIVGYVVNSFIVAVFTVVLNLILSAMAAYPLARMEFAGKKIAFFAVLATIMVPFQAIMLPVYIITLKLNLVDSYGIIPGFIGMILPFAVNAFGIFLLRQAFLSIPKELEESAVVDGCSSWQIFFKILLPMIKPSLAVLAIFTFIGSWGEFLWPSIVLTNEKLFTLPVGINNLQGAFSANYRLIAAGSMISIVPIVVFFVSLQKYFISGANEGAVKG